MPCLFSVSGIPVGIAVARQRGSSPSRAVEEASKQASKQHQHHHQQQDKQRDDLRMLLPARRSNPTPLAPAVINTVAHAAPTTAALMVHPHDRTATLMTSSIGKSFFNFTAPFLCFAPT